jgi:hypothetical protein
MARRGAALESDETVVFQTGLHPVVLGGTVGLAAFVVGVTALIVFRNDLPGGTVVRLWLAAAVVVAVAFVSPLARWRTFAMVLTSRRLLATVRVLRAQTVEVPLRDLEAVSVEQTWVGRLLGYGTVHVLGRNGELESFPRVASANALRDAVLRQAPSRATRAR